MKKYFFVTVSIFCLQITHAQVNDPNQVAKDAATSHVNNNMDNAAENGLNKAENSIKGLFKKKNKPAQADSAQPGKTGNTQTKQNPDTETRSQASLGVYANYDFVPGDKIIFQSQLADEETGQIPSQFIISEGQMDVQLVNNENVIHIPSGAGCTFSPRMNSKDYLPDQFTIEFDIKNERFGLAHLNFNFGNEDNIIKEINFGDGGGVTWTTGDVEFPASLNVSGDFPMTWHHIAIAINKTAGKIYVDEYRVANVNNITGKAQLVNFVVNGYENSFIKNIRIAAGGIDIYKKITTESKIITHGILFDVDKASIKPESMGTINSIYSLLKKDPSLKFEIDGHTDNSGDAVHNLTLSQQRADAVKTQLMNMGIDASRLTTKGFGDTKPISDNSSPEGKANNRRVEFLKR
jgi:OOP family OmpA-OmpF porin